MADKGEREAEPGESRRRVVGVFAGVDQARRAAEAMAAVGITRDRIACGGPGAADDVLPGVPTDERFVCEDALRRGRALLVVDVADDGERGVVRGAIQESGGETPAIARERWWRDLRAVEAAKYAAAGGDFTADEAAYRLGFEAAMAGSGRTFDENLDLLRRHYPAVHEAVAFRQGYESGRQYVVGLVAPRAAGAEARDAGAHRAA